MGSIDQSRWLRHRWINGLQTLWLILALLAMCTLAGWLILGEMGLVVALAAGLVSLLIEPAASSILTLRLYRARPIRPQDAPELWRLMQELAARARLPQMPSLYYVPSRVVNAFAVGSRQNASIAVTDGLLQTLSPRELAGVLAHEVAHIAHGDLRVMSLADSISRLTSLLALLGQVLLVLALPFVLLGAAEINLWGFLLLALSPHLALLAQMGLSRVREFDADQAAAALTGDPEGLARALGKIERLTRSWRFFLQPGWGNPDASWLRTHPATTDRIARLMAITLSRQPVSSLSLSPLYSVPFRNLPLRTPRWHLWGHWR